MEELADISIHAFIQKYEIKNEKGDLIDFKDHPFLFDIYRDQSQFLCVMKGAQVGMSTLDVIKTLYDAKRNKMDIIYTLPTDNDVELFVGGKVNRIIDQNPIFQLYTADKDSIEQKRVGNSMVYFRGTWTERAAIMVTADRLVHDEKDSSKQDVVKQYQARLQHSKFKQVHVFSHPSADGTGVHVEWLQSDQKHWFVKCSHCKKWQYLSWPQSIDMEKKIYICKKCGGEITDNDRRHGQWVAKYKGRKYSGYWVPLLIAPYVPAAEIIEKFNDKDTTEEFFYNKVLGLPYTGSGNKLTKSYFAQNLTTEDMYPEENDRVIIGIDTGKNLHIVIGTSKGLFHFEEKRPTEKNDHDPWIEVYGLMERWSRAIAIVDQGGDLIGSRKFQAKYRGRVFLCAYREDAKGKQLVKFGKKDELGTVQADRNRLISFVVEEFTDRRIPVMGEFETGTDRDWYDYWIQWNNLTKVKELDPKTGQVKRRIWVRAGADHYAHATVYWRIGAFRFGSNGATIPAHSNLQKPQTGVLINPDGTIEGQPPGVIWNLTGAKKDDDWRT